jgi:hypothetical protein
VHLFEDCNLCAIHAKRVTISKCPVPCLHRRTQGCAQHSIALKPALLPEDAAGPVLRAHVAGATMPCFHGKCWWWPSQALTSTCVYSICMRV